MMYLSLIVQALTLAAVYSANIENDETFHSVLGKAIYVPRENLLGDIPNGISFFMKIPDKCLRKTDVHTTTKDQSFYKNTAQFYKSVATETSLGIQHEGHFNLGASLDATTKSISGSKRDVSGTSLNLVTKAFEQQVEPNCLYETKIHSRLLRDFSALKTKISSPHHKSSWSNYQRFLNTHGSHVITAVTFGASIDQYAFAEKSSSYSVKEFTVKACTSLAKKVAVASISVSACSGVSSEEIKKLSEKRMTSSITIRGGTSDTRHQLHFDRSNESILKFLGEGESNPAPIQYKLIPIWQILAEQRKIPNAQAKASNLQYYFDGFLSFGCAYIRGKRGPDLQTFNLAPHSGDSNPVYQCSIAGKGCHDDRDCHYKSPSWCSCEGNSCINYKVTNSEGMPRSVPFINKEPWGWNGCDWKFVGFECECADPINNRNVIWPMV